MADDAPAQPDPTPDAPAAGEPAGLDAQIASAIEAALPTVVKSVLESVNQPAASPEPEADEPPPAARSDANLEKMRTEAAAAAKRYEERIAALEEANRVAEETATRARWTEAVRKELAMQPLHPGAEKHILSEIETRGQTLQEDGSVAMVKDGAKPVLLEECITEIRKDQPFLFVEKSANRSTVHRMRTPGQQVKQRIAERDLTPDFVNQNIDSIQSGEIVVMTDA